MFLGNIPTTWYKHCDHNLSTAYEQTGLLQIVVRDKVNQLGSVIQMVNIALHPVVGDLLKCSKPNIKVDLFCAQYNFL